MNHFLKLFVNGNMQNLFVFRLQSSFTKKESFFTKYYKDFYL